MPRRTVLALLLGAAPIAATGAAARPPIPRPSITILSTTVTVRNGVAPIRLSCVEGEAIMLTCHGTLVLRDPSKHTVGKIAFAIKNCCSRPYHVVSVPLSAAARGRLRQSHALRVTATATLNGRAARSSRSVVLR